MQRRRLLALALAATLAPPARAAEPVRVLMLGDSLTAGYGLPPEAGLVPALGRWLAARGAAVRMMNAGLSGDTTWGGTLRIVWALRRAPADVVVIELGANDMLLGWPVTQAEANLRRIIARARAGDQNRPVLLLGIHPFGGPAARTQAWRAMWPRLAARTGAALVPDLYAGIRAQGSEAGRARLLQADRLHANEAGVATIVGVVGPPLLALVRQIAAARP